MSALDVLSSLANTLDVSLSPAYLAISDASRRRILQLLANGELAAGDIAQQFEMAWPSVSRHLGVLKTAGLVSGKRSGSNIVYSLVPSALDELIADLKPGGRTASGKRYRLALATIGLRGDPTRPEEDREYYRLQNALGQDFDIIRASSQRYRTPEETADALLLEDPDVIGIVDHFGGGQLVPEVLTFLRDAGLYDVPIFVAGSFSLEAIASMQHAGVGACLLEGIGTESFVDWLHSALSARDALKALLQETSESYELGGSFAAVTQSDFNQKVSEQGHSIETLINGLVPPKVTVTKIEVDHSEGKLKVTIYTPQPGQLLGRKGAILETIRHAIGDLTDASNISVNVAEDADPKREH